MNDRIKKMGKLQQKILKHITECENIERGFGEETVSHIAESLGCSQPTILKSVKILIEYHYLDSLKFVSHFYYTSDTQDSKKTGGSKTLFVTPKGAAAAIVSGVNIDKVEKYLDYIVDDDKSAPRNYRAIKYVNYINEHYDKYKEKYPKYPVTIGPGSTDLIYIHDLKIVKPNEPTAMILSYIRKIAEPPTNSDLVIKKAMIYALENNYFEDAGVTNTLTAEQIGKLKLFIALQHIQALGDIPTLKQFVSKYKINKDFLKKQLRRQKEYINLAIKELG